VLSLSLFVPGENCVSSSNYKPKFKLIGLAGKIGSGKTTAAEIMGEFGYKRVRFARALKDMSEAGGVPRAYLEEQELKKKEFDFLDGRDPFAVAFEMVCNLIGTTPVEMTTGNVSWGEKPECLFGKSIVEAIDALVDSGIFNPPGTTTSARKIQQLLGTEWGREQINENLWLYMFDKDCAAAGEYVIVDDCRFPNEVTHIHSKGGVVVRIRSADDETSNNGIAGHASEQEIEGDVRVWNEKKDRGVLKARLLGALEQAHVDEIE
jgi:hypothetical protein